MTSLGMHAPTRALIFYEGPRGRIHTYSFGSGRLTPSAKEWLREMVGRLPRVETVRVINSTTIEGPRLKVKMQKRFLFFKHQPPNDAIRAAITIALGMSQE